MVRIPSDLLPPPADRSTEPLYALPGRLLAAGWAVAASAAIGGWFIVAQVRPIEPETLRWGVLSAVLGVVIGGLGLLVMVPWKPRRSGDLAPLWMASTVLRILAVPGLGILLYFAARPPERPLVIGLAGATLLLLAIEVPIIAAAMLRQLAEEEAAAPGSSDPDDATADGSDDSDSVADRQ